MRWTVLWAACLTAGCLGPWDDGGNATPETPTDGQDTDPTPGASWGPGVWQVSKCTTATAGDDPIDVIVQTGSSLHKFAWGDGLEENATLHIAGFGGQNVVITGEVHRSPEGYVAGGSWAGDEGLASGLLLLDERLGVQAGVEVPQRDLADFAVDGGRIYATGENLSVFDLELNLLTVVDLPLDHEGKQAHDILVTNGKIYLLDNVILPIYLLIYDQETLELEQRIQENGQRLKGQWYDDERQEWGVINPLGFMGASNTEVLRYDAQGTFLGRTSTFSGRYSPSGGDNGDRDEKGYKIEGWTQEGPLWLAFAGNGSVSVGPVSFDDGITACEVAASQQGFQGLVAREGQVAFSLGGQLRVHLQSGALLAHAEMPVDGKIVA